MPFGKDKGFCNQGGELLRLNEVRVDLRARVDALESLCARSFSALEISLGNVRSLKAASPGVRAYDEWETILAAIVESQPPPIISVNPTN